MSQIIRMADIGQLFQTSNKAEPTQKIRPLGALSDYVVERFPADLIRFKAFCDERRGRPTRALGIDILQVRKDELTMGIEKLIVANPIKFQESQLGVARLDLMMLEAGLRAHGLECGLSLGFLIKCLSDKTRQQPILSYQDVILNNPPSDMRTFTNGACGKQEADFYRGHQMIESCLWRRDIAAATIH